MPEDILARLLPSLLARLSQSTSWNLAVELLEFLHALATLAALRFHDTLKKREK